MKSGINICLFCFAYRVKVHRSKRESRFFSIVQPGRPNTNGNVIERPKISSTAGFSSACEIARNNIREAQERYKGQYDKKTTPINVNISDWVFVKREIRRKEKLSCVFEGPYCAVGSGSNTVQVRPSSPRDIQFGEIPSLPFRSAGCGCCNSATWSSSCWRTSKQVGKGKCNTVLDLRTLLMVADVA